MAYSDFIHQQSADHARATEGEMSTFYCLQIVLACVLPPVAVFLERGCGAEVIICIALCCLALLPGMIYALYIVCKYETSLTTYAPPGDKRQWTAIPAPRVTMAEMMRESDLPPRGDIERLNSRDRR